METLQSTIFIEFDVNTKKITFLRGDNIVDYDSNVTNVYARVKYKDLSGNTTYLSPSELEDYKFSLYTIKPATNNVNVITGEVTDELKENVYGGVVKFEIPRVCTNRLGIVKCEIHINQGNKIIGSSTFVLDVKQSLVTAFDDGLLGDEDFPVLKQLILEIQKDSNIDDYNRSKITSYSSDKVETIIDVINNNKINKNGIGEVTWGNLSQEVKTNITGGNTPVVGINSVSTENIVNHSITTEKLAFWVNEHVNFGDGKYPEIYSEGSKLIIELKANTDMFTKPRIGGADIVYSFPTEDTTITLEHNEVLIWDLTQNKVIQQNVSSARPENNILLVYNHYGNFNYGAILEFCSKVYKKRTRKGEWGYFDKTATIDTASYTITFPAVTSIIYAGGKYTFTTEQTIKIDEKDYGINAFIICFDTKTKKIMSVIHSTNNGSNNINENSVILGWIDRGTKEYAYLNGRFKIDGLYSTQTIQVGMFSTLKPVNIDTTKKEITFPSGISIWYSNHRYIISKEQKIKFDDYPVKAIYFNTKDKQFYSVIRSETMDVPDSYVLIGWVDTGVPQKSYMMGNYTVDGHNTFDLKLNNQYNSQTILTGLEPIKIETNKIIFPKGFSIWSDNERYAVTDANTKLEVMMDRSRGNCYGVYFDRGTKTIEAVYHPDIPGYNKNNKILIGCVDFGTPEVGHFNGNFTWEGKSTNEGIKETSEGRGKVIENFAADQGMTVIRDEIWVFRHSNDDHSTYGNIEVYDKDTFTHKGVIHHNLGHAGGADYCPETDTLMETASNLTYGDVIIQPEIILVPNISNKKVGSTINYNEEAISVKLHEVEDGVVTKHLGGTGIVWTFGESPYIAYGQSFIDDKTGSVMYDKCYFFKVILGTGDIDYSDSEGNDSTKFGTFIPGKTANEYNGTAKLLKKYTAPYLGINQGICYHEGYIYLAVTTKYNVAEVVKLSLMEDGTIKEEKRFRCPSINRDNTSPGYEAEGCAILDGRYLIAGYRGHNTQNLSLFPLYNEQGGKGTTDTKINLHFKCNSTPQIIITPTSPVTDLYISEITYDSFTVKSSSGGSGTFNWSCKIS